MSDLGVFDDPIDQLIEQMQASTSKMFAWRYNVKYVTDVVCTEFAGKGSLEKR